MSEIRENPEGIRIQGKQPPQFKQMLEAVDTQRRAQAAKQPGQPMPPAAPAEPQIRVTGSPKLEELINAMRGKSGVYQEIKLPSRGAFYDGTDGPTDGILHIRAMTGEEESVLTQPNLVKKGQATNIIFQKCMQEPYRADNLLSVDRQFLLIELRALSYTPIYDVEVKCPDCDRKFNTAINLSEIRTDYCPSDFCLPLTETLPQSGYKFSYRLSRGRDESHIREYKDHQLRQHGNAGTDNSLMYMMAMLLEDVEGIKDKTELQTLIKSMPVQDVSYLRSVITEPPFGMDTKCEIICGFCMHDFSVELPYESNFFFPRQRKTERSRQ